MCWRPFTLFVTFFASLTHQPAGPSGACFFLHWPSFMRQTRGDQRKPKDDPAKEGKNQRKPHTIQGTTTEETLAREKQTPRSFFAGQPQGEKTQQEKSKTKSTRPLAFQYEALETQTKTRRTPSHFLRHGALGLGEAAAAQRRRGAAALRALGVLQPTPRIRRVGWRRGVREPR